MVKMTIEKLHNHAPKQGTSVLKASVQLKNLQGRSVQLLSEKEKPSFWHELSLKKVLIVGLILTPLVLPPLIFAATALSGKLSSNPQNTGNDNSTTEVQKIQEPIVEGSSIHEIVTQPPIVPEHILDKIPVNLKVDDNVPKTEIVEPKTENDQISNIPPQEKNDANVAPTNIFSGWSFNLWGNSKETKEANYALDVKGYKNRRRDRADQSFNKEISQESSTKVIKDEPENERNNTNLLKLLFCIGVVAYAKIFNDSWLNKPVYKRDRVHKVSDMNEKAILDDIREKYAKFTEKKS